MVFDGSKEKCPNYNGGELKTDYPTWVDNKSNVRDPSFSSSNFQKTCFQICGEGSYVENSECRPCPSDFYRSNNSNTVNPDHISASFVEMCDYKNDTLMENGVPVWFQRQKDGNLKHELFDKINWSSASSAIKDPNTEGGKIQNYWKSTNKPLSNEEILRLIGNRTAGTLEYMLPSKYLKSQPIGRELNIEVFDFDKLRKDINKGRGSVVFCEAETLNNWVDSNGNSNLQQGFRQCWNSNTETYSNTNNNTPVFGPEHIVAEEVEDFIVDILDEAREAREEGGAGGGIAAVQSLSSLLSNLSYDSGFEKCVNGVLNTGDLNDFDIQERIKAYISINEFQTEDIHYLKRKLRKIVNLKGSEVTECLNILNLGKSICSTGVADKTLMIGSLKFQVIGNDKIDVMQADNDERYKLNKLIDELGPLIPRAVKNIIEISKEYEARVCNVPTNTTLLLERLYTDLYAKETKVTFDLTPNFDLNFNELASTPNFWFFIQKIIVLVVLSVLLFMATNFLMVFLSRTQVVTQVNDG